MESSSHLETANPVEMRLIVREHRRQSPEVGSRGLQAWREGEDSLWVWRWSHRPIGCGAVGTSGKNVGFIYGHEAKIRMDKASEWSSFLEGGRAKCRAPSRAKCPFTRAQGSASPPCLLVDSGTHTTLALSCYFLPSVITLTVPATAWLLVFS